MSITFYIIVGLILADLVLTIISYYSSRQDLDYLESKLTDLRRYALNIQSDCRTVEKSMYSQVEIIKNAIESNASTIDALKPKKRAYKKRGPRPKKQEESA